MYGLDRCQSFVQRDAPTPVYSRDPQRDAPCASLQPGPPAGDAPYTSLQPAPPAGCTIHQFAAGTPSGIHRALVYSRHPQRDAPYTSLQPAPPAGCTIHQFAAGTPSGMHCTLVYRRHPQRDAPYASLQTAPPAGYIIYYVCSPAEGCKTHILKYDGIKLVSNRFCHLRPHGRSSVAG